MRRLPLGTVGCGFYDWTSGYLHFHSWQCNSDAEVRIDTLRNRYEGPIDPNSSIVPMVDLISLDIEG